jgi:hypothetical protein
MTHPFPPPPITPFERLQASDGLLINAERWRQAHDYHRRRQNVHYQCLNQPGIVCGLGVRDIPAPHNVEARYRDGRWVQVQPGIAIDVAGNLIVMPNSYDFPIDMEVARAEPITVYLVVSYVDPDELRLRQQRDTVQETFRIDQRNTVPQSLEIEICRIRLEPGQTSITQPADVFFPGYNNIDLRYRRQAQARPTAIVRIAQVNHRDPECIRNFYNLSYFLQAVEPLYPLLQGAEEVSQVSLGENNPEYNLLHEMQKYDLLYLTGNQGLFLDFAELECVKSYLNSGGVLLVDAPLDAQPLIESVHQLAQQLENPLVALEDVPRQRSHPLRTQPFLFGALPIVNQHPVRLSIGGGIILVIGELASAWGLERDLNLPRLMIRTAQELGINILHYAWKRRQLIGLQQEDTSGRW